MSPWLAGLGCAICIVLGWASLLSLQSSARRLRSLVQKDSGVRSANWDEAVTNARTEFGRDLVLVVLLASGGAYFAYSMAAWFIEREGVIMGDFSASGVRVVFFAFITIVLFLLFDAVFPRVLPDTSNPKLTRSAAALLALGSAILVVTSQQLYDTMIGDLQQRVGGLLGLFLSVVFAAATLFLGWKQVTTTFRPVSKRRPGETVETRESASKNE